MEGITEAYRQDVEMSPKEFKVNPEYDNIYTIAQNVTSTMQNSEVIDDFRTIAKQIFERKKSIWMNEL